MYLLNWTIKLAIVYWDLNVSGFMQWFPSQNHVSKCLQNENAVHEMVFLTSDIFSVLLIKSITSFLDGEKSFTDFAADSGLNA